MTTLEIFENLMLPLKAKLGEESWNFLISRGEKFIEQINSQNSGKPIVSGSLPPIDVDKLAIAWQALEWVGFSRGEEFNDDDVLKMLGGNDR